MKNMFLKFKKSDIFGTFHVFQMSIFRKVPNIFKNSEYNNFGKVLSVRKAEIWEIR